MSYTGSLIAADCLRDDKTKANAGFRSVSCDLRKKGQNTILFAKNLQCSLSVYIHICLVRAGRVARWCWLTSGAGASY